MEEFVNRQENQPLWGKELLCSFCGSDYIISYWCSGKQIACGDCLMDYLEKELFIDKKYD